VAKDVEKDFREKYPPINCDGVDPTIEEAELDYNKGDSSTGYLHCFCLDQFKQIQIDVVDIEFPISKDTLCKPWLESYTTSNLIIIGSVLLVVITNIFFKHILRCKNLIFFNNTI
jgi:hypothetical protein